MRQAGTENKKKIVSNSIPTRPGQEKSKKNSRKIQKIIKHHSGIISIQTGMRQVEKERKILVPNSVPTRYGLENSKKIAKKYKKLKKFVLSLFLSKSSGHRLRRRKKNFHPEFRSYPTRARKFSKKKSKKIQKSKKLHSGIISIKTRFRQVG